MPNFRLCAFGLLLMTTTGCSSGMMHDFQPHRLWRLNRGPAPGSGALYSIPPEPLLTTQDVDATANTDSDPEQLLP